MFNKDELKIISRALTGYMNQLSETKRVIEETFIPGDETILRDVGERMANTSDLDEKVQKELWKLIHKKEVRK